MTETTLKPSPQIRWKSIALPAEHGGWGFLIEPMLLGLLVAFSPAGVALCVAALGVFLIHQPLKIALKDRLSRRRYARTRWAEQFALGYALLALAGLLLALYWAQGDFWPPLLLAVPLAAVQLLYESRGRGREFLPEAAGALALGAVAPAVALAGGGGDSSLLLWGFMALRVVPSLLYVRARLRQIRGKPASPLVSLAAHLAACLVLALLWLAGWMNALPLFGAVVLLARAAYGLTQRRVVPAKIVGIQEMIYGLLFALLSAAGVG